MDDQLNEVIS